MKHIKKYNESLENKLDVDYINSCFIDFIDNGAEVNIGDKFDELDNNLEYVEYVIYLPGVSNDGEWLMEDRETLESNIEYVKNLLELYSDIDTSINKLKSKYSDVKIGFMIEQEKFKSNYNSNLFLLDAYIIIEISPLTNK